MRNYIKRGGMTNKSEYERLRDDVYDEVYSLEKEGVLLQDNDIQQIAMLKARDKNLHNFKVCTVSNPLNAVY